MSKKEYLGDSVYVELNEHLDIVLTTENGFPEPTNRIVLEPSVAVQLVKWIERLTQ